MRRDPSTGFLHRRYLIEELRARLSEPVKGGVRQIAYIKPDKFGAIQADIGIVASEDFLVAFAELLRDQLAPNDLAGRFGGNSFVVLVERGTARDVEAWAEHFVKRVAGNVFQVAQKSFSATCTVGLGVMPPAQSRRRAARSPTRPQPTSADATQAVARFYTVDKADTDTRVQAYDQIWVKHIKSALMENRFRLVQQPIASLQGEDKGMFDVLVRMLDETGKEVLPSEFMAAAERNDLMKNIDRWVIGASMSFCAARKPERIFVRLSKDTVLDRSLAPWLQNQLKAMRIEPRRICFQITEETATQYLTQTKELAVTLRKLGFACALEHFRHRARLPRSAVCDSGTVHQDRRLADAGPGDEQRDAAEGQELRVVGEERQDRDDRRARRGRQHHGRAVAARHRVHPGLFRQRPGRSRHRQPLTGRAV